MKKFIRSFCSLFIIVIIVSQIDLKICLVLTCWLTTLNGAFLQVTRNVCRGRDVYSIQSTKSIDSNLLEIGACLKQTKIDIILPYRCSCLFFFSLSCFYLLRKVSRHNLNKDNHQATSTRIKRQMMP